MSDGLAGGYPGAPNAYLWHRNGTPGSNAASAGETLAVDWGVFPLMDNDTLEVRWNGGGGIGDPLQRVPRAVLADLGAGVVSTDVARDVYGVILEAGRIDERSTKAARERLLAARGAGTARGRSDRETPLSLEFVGAGSEITVCCAHCAHTLARRGEAWKSALEPRERPMNEVMATYTTIERVKLREYACPACGALLDCETAYEGDPPLLDYVGAIPDA
jgi:hypothetical protein